MRPGRQPVRSRRRGLAPMAGGGAGGKAGKAPIVCEGLGGGAGGRGRCPPRPAFVPPGELRNAAPGLPLPAAEDRGGLSAGGRGAARRLPRSAAEERLPGEWPWQVPGLPELRGRAPWARPRFSDWKGGAKHPILRFAACSVPQVCVGVAPSDRVLVGQWLQAGRGG